MNQIDHTSPTKLRVRRDRGPRRTVRIYNDTLEKVYALQQPRETMDDLINRLADSLLRRHKVAEARNRD